MNSEQLQTQPSTYPVNSYNPYNTNSSAFDFELWAQAVRSQMLNVVQKKTGTASKN